MYGLLLPGPAHAEAAQAIPAHSAARQGGLTALHRLRGSRRLVAARVVGVRVVRRLQIVLEAVVELMY